jgi:drug/metabolite transporter (DMT)-like permease
MNTASQGISRSSWLLLGMLSVLWGGSFLFIGIAVKELPSLLIVFARVIIAAAVLLPVHFLMQGALPRDRRTWIAAGGMAVMNNIVPFSLIVYAQHLISAGLASVINATTPFFGAVVMAVAGAEALSGRKSAGIVIGVIGVAVLRGFSFGGGEPEHIGVLAVLAASMGYGASSLWAKKTLGGIPPITTATCQLICSSVMMVVIVSLFSDVSQFAQASAKTWLALIALAVLSTSLAYLLFFRIIATAGASVVLLVTMIIPVPASILAWLVLGDALTLREIAGAALIGVGLLVIDGRAVRYLRGR